MLSKYNIYGTDYIYNVLEDKIVKFDGYKKEYKLLEELKNKKIIIGDLTNELESLFEKYIKFITNGDTLYLTLIITNQCNFMCAYCYENDNEVVQFNKESSQILINFLLEEYKRQPYKKVIINWFGGEPLLKKDLVIQLSNTVKNICEERNIIYLGHITTNGYFLDYAVFDKLLRSNIIFYQITIDGEKNLHNSLRPPRNGLDSYSRIFKNLKDIYENTEKSLFYKIGIRNNVCTYNIESVKRFIKKFQNEFPDDRFFTFQHTIDNWGGNRIHSLNSQLMTSIQLDNNGFENKFYKNQDCCDTHFLRSYTIAGDLEVYECNHHMFNDMRSIGKINKNGSLRIKKLNNRVLKINNIKCLSCKYLPQCIYARCPLKNIEPERGCVNVHQKITQKRIQQLLEQNSNG